MKKTTQLLIASLALSISAGPLTALADTYYESNGVVEFTPSEEPTQPTDPTDPTNPVSPIDPTNPEGPNPGTNGPLSIDFASSFDFGVQRITSKTQTYYAYAQQYKVYENGQLSNQIKEGPNYVQVTDNRGTESGWTLKVRQEGQFVSETGKLLTGALIKLDNGNVVTASDSAKPTGTETISLNPAGTEATVMTAKVGSGAGTYLLDWGTDAATGAESVSLEVPGSTTKYAEKYTTKLVWSLTDVPEN